MTIRGRELRPSMTGIKCPACGHQTSTVKDSRPTDDHTAIRRRRLCLKCGRRATTFESYADSDDRDAARHGAQLQQALEACPAHQRRLLETLIFQIAADDRRARAAEAAAIEAAANEQVEADDRAD
jgi:transcriptional regulator NrdR family protein